MTPHNHNPSLAPNGDSAPSRAELNHIVDTIEAAGAVASTPPPMVPPLTPAKIEVLMKRMLLSPEIVEMANYRRDGEHDLGPLAQVVLQCTRAEGGTHEDKAMAFAVTVQLATWALATFAKLEGQQVTGGAQ